MTVETLTPRRAVCTVVSKNYLASARTLAESLQHQMPDLPLFVLLVDELDATIDPATEPFTLISVRELPIPHRQPFLFKYDILELNTAVKPYFFAYLSQKYSIQKLLYFDPDIYVFSPLSDIWEALENASLVLTPHTEEPIQDAFKPNEIDFLRVGVYNLGFLGMSCDHPQMPAILTWWQQRLYEGCLVDLENGYFTDQKWMDLTPALFPDVTILRKPQYNVAYWNLAARQSEIEWSEATGEHPRPKLGGEPLGFFHYSGYDPTKPNVVSKHQDRFASMEAVNRVRPLFDFYRNRLLANGYVETRKLPYAFAHFDDGTPIPSVVRRLYRSLPYYAEQFPDPFATGAGTFLNNLKETYRDASTQTRSETGLSRLWWHIWQTHPYLQTAFPDPAVRDRFAFTNWVYGDGRVVLGEIPAALLPSPIESEEGMRAKRSTGAINPDAVAKARVSPRLRRLLGAPLKALLWSRNKELLDKIYYWSLGPKITQSLWSRPASLPTSLRVLPNIKVGTETQYPFGVNVTGYLTGEFGVAEAARAIVRSLQMVAIPVALSNLIAEGQRSNDTSLTDFSEDRPYATNLIAVNADMVGATLQEKGSDWLQNRYTIGLWFWELAEFPEMYQSSFTPFQEIWVTSTFTANVLAQVSPVPIVKITYPVALDERGISPERPRWNLPESAFVFLFSFDIRSFLARKNPKAVIEAFRRAFGKTAGQDDVLLLIKILNGDQFPEQMAQLEQLASGLNVRFLTETLTQRETYSLTAACDALVSLHRAEGLGLTIAEAMFLGKPVIATGYSGNMEFMTLNNSLPVGYRLVEIEEDCGPYQKGNVWAEADVDDAAAKMRRLFEDREFARQLGEIAAEDIRRQHSPVAVGKQIKARLNRILGR